MSPPALAMANQAAIVRRVADALGYDSVSAFVAMFRRNFGQPPARYFAHRPLSA